MKITNQNKNELLLIALCFALCILVIGLTLKYNALVSNYNELVPIAEKCIIPKFNNQDAPLLTINLTQFNLQNGGNG